MMKDTTNNFDILQSQQHSWNSRHHHQQPTANTTSVYVNHQVASQTNTINAAANAQSHQVRTVGQNHQPGISSALSNQFHQLQSNAHHANTAAFYPHLYPTYQAHTHEPQHLQNDALQHDHMPVSTMASSVSAALSAHLHLQQTNNSQDPNSHSLNHWNAANLGHHGVADHATLAYITAIQNHHTTVADHHRNPAAPMSTQSMNTTSNHHSNYHQIDQLYNSSAAAYGYNLHNAAFFRPPNEAAHAQSGHHSNAEISSFWNHQNNHNQTQSAASRHQADQQPNYIHDPRHLYYNRTSFNNQPNVAPFDQDIQQNSHHSIDATQHRESTVDQQIQIPSDRLPQSIKQPIQISPNDQQKRSEIGNKRNATQPLKQHQSIDTLNKYPHSKTNQKMDTSVESPQNKQDNTQNNKVLDHVVRGPVTINSNNDQSRDKMIDHQSEQKEKISPNRPSESSETNSYLSARDKSSSQRKPVDPNNETRSQYKLQTERNVQKQTNHSGDQHSSSDFVKHGSIHKTDKKDGPVDSMAEDLNSLTLNTISPKKTTWASIASQPAKISQPKSLKSKMAASNSVLSSAKHLAAVSLDTASLDGKNGINHTIKTSVATAVSTLQRGTLPLSSVVSSRLSCKLDFSDGIETSKISWPAMNAAAAEMKNAEKAKEASARTSNEGNVDPINNNNNNNFNQYQDDDDKVKKEEFIKDKVSQNQRDNSYSKDNNLRHNRSNPTHMQNGRESWESRKDRQNYDVRGNSEIRDDIRDYDRRESRNIRSNDYNNDDQYRDRYYKRNIPLSQDRDQRDYYYNRGNGQNRYDSNRDNNQNSSYGSKRGEKSLPISDEKTNYSSHPQKDFSSVKQQYINKDEFNPKVFDLEPENARYFIIKSYSEDDIYRSIKYSIWCSTNHGNKKLDEAYQQQLNNGPLYLFFSVNGSGRFCGMAQMTSAVDFDSSTGVWAQSKWQGEFSVKWLYVKDVPNSHLRHITLENNEDKPVTNSRDTQEVPSEKGKAVLKVLHKFPHTSSIFDDIQHFERKQEMEKTKKSTNYDNNHYSSNHRHDDRRQYTRPFVSMRSSHNNSNQRERPARFD